MDREREAWHILPAQFRENGVLQAGVPITFWGSTQKYGENGELATGKAEVHFEFGSIKKIFPVNPEVDGWNLTIDPLEATAKLRTLTVRFIVDGVDTPFTDIVHQGSDRAAVMRSRDVMVSFIIISFWLWVTGFFYLFISFYILFFDIFYALFGLFICFYESAQVAIRSVGIFFVLRCFIRGVFLMCLCGVGATATYGNECNKDGDKRVHDF